MSYKRAWDSVDAMNRIAGEPLVVTKTGGRGGGGAQLSQEAYRLIERYEEIQKRIERFCAGLEATPQISARNKVLVQIRKIKHKGRDVVVQGVFGSQKLKAIITHDAYRELQLREGERVWFLFKARATTSKDVNPLTGRLVERIDEEEIKMEVEEQLLHIRGKFKIKGFSILVHIDPKEIIIAKGYL